MSFSTIYKRPKTKLNFMLTNHNIGIIILNVFNNKIYYISYNNMHNVLKHIIIYFLPN